MEVVGPLPLANKPRARSGSGGLLCSEWRRMKSGIGFIGVSPALLEVRYRVTKRITNDDDDDDDDDDEQCPCWWF